MIAVCAASSDCRAPAGKTCRCADLHCARLFRGESGAISANERRPQSSQGKLATKKRRQSFLESVFYVPSEKALASPPHTFATAGDSGMLESCPSRPPANREGIRLRRCPVGSNAQVPANWAFLQILAQSPFFSSQCISASRTCHWDLWPVCVDILQANQRRTTVLPAVHPAYSQHP